MDKTTYFTELIRVILEQHIPKDRVHELKKTLAKQYKLKQIPTDIEVLMNASTHDYQLLKAVLQTKPTRTISGVTVIAIMCYPYPCPHGKCIMCPGGPESIFGDVPQSYTGKEPASMRAIRNHYDAYLQIFNRLEQYVVLGQSPEKVELIIMGGTFPAYEQEYRNDFIRDCYQAMNDFSAHFYEANVFLVDKFKKFFELPGIVGNEARTQVIHKKILQLKQEQARTLEAEQTTNETAKIKCVGLTIETKPDWGKLDVGNDLLRYGCTRVELGIQSVYDDALHRINRGHTIRDSKESIQILKDLGFKLNFHYMPGLPGLVEDRKKDVMGMQLLFTDPAFRPDMLKLYPTMVMPGTPLFRQYEKGEFTPLDADEAITRIVELKKVVPRYCRIMRIQRDIPTYKTVAGVEKTNIRQDIKKRMDEHKVSCQCIRCREIRGRASTGTPTFEIIVYDASGGKEFFISIKDETDKLLGFVRLRFPKEFLREEITPTSALIRELHVYGTSLHVGKTAEQKDTQHKGFGKQLMERAEKICKEHKKDKIIVISGVGVREYYKKIGYHLEGPYMVKNITHI